MILRASSPLKKPVCLRTSSAVGPLPRDRQIFITKIVSVPGERIIGQVPRSGSGARLNPDLVLDRFHTIFGARVLGYATVLAMLQIR
jgi:hypothetical protein